MGMATQSMFKRAGSVDLSTSTWASAPQRGLARKMFVSAKNDKASKYAR